MQFLQHSAFIKLGHVPDAELNQGVIGSLGAQVRRGKSDKNVHFLAELLEMTEGCPADDAT